METSSVEEHDDPERARSSNLLGPYESREEAQGALEKAQARNEAWDAEDEAWDRGPQRGEGHNG
ncbi:MAG: hypothetical protein WBG36_00230 [Ornithinimicrobium sp.]